MSTGNVPALERPPELGGRPAGHSSGPSSADWRRWVPERPVLIAWVILIGVLGWTYGSTFFKLVTNWYSMPDYGHGFVVPLFAAYLLWHRQAIVTPWPDHGTWWAVVFFVIWALARWVNMSLRYERDIDTIFPLLIGIALFLGGWQGLHWSWPSIVFLEFMVPLPAFVAVSMSQPLQWLATKGSVYTLQTVGVPAIVPGDLGNVIQLSNPANRLEVAQACSGLRMLTVFFALCVGAALVLRVHWLEKLIIVVSAVPIALISNVLRITLDGMLTEWFSAEAGHYVHDHAELIMMPFAMGLIWLEMIVISKLFPETPETGPLSLTRSAPAALTSAAARRDGSEAASVAD